MAGPLFIKRKDMKKLMLMAFCALACSLMAKEVTVKTSVEGNNNSRTYKQCYTKARRLAVAKFIKGLGVEVGESLVEKAASSYQKFTEADVTKEGDWDYEDGTVTADLVVVVRDEAVLQWLNENGVTLNQGAAGQGSDYKIVVAEDLPDAGFMKMAEAMGTGTDGKAFFLMRYTDFQKRVKSAIGKEINRIGLSVKDLDDDPAYEEFKKEDPALVGGTFDPDVGSKGDWKKNEQFVEKIRNTDPQTVLLYYRVSSLLFDQSTRKARVNISLKVKDLGDNVGTRDLGNQPVQSGTLNTNQPDSLCEDLGNTVGMAAVTLMSGEDLNGKLQGMFKELSVAAAKPKGPMKVVVDASRVDSKIRTRFKVALKKALIAAGVTDQAHIKIQQNNITAEVIDKEIPDGDELWVKVLEVLDGCGVEATDDQKTFKNGVLSVTPGK